MCINRQASFVEATGTRLAGLHVSYHGPHVSFRLRPPQERSHAPRVLRYPHSAPTTPRHLGVNSNLRLKARLTLLARAPRSSGAVFPHRLHFFGFLAGRKMGFVRHVAPLACHPSRKSRSGGPKNGNHFRYPFFGPKPSPKMHPTGGKKRFP